MSVRAIQAAAIGQRFVGDLAGVKAGERVMVLVDRMSMFVNEDVIYSVCGLAESAGADVTLAMMPDRKFGNERLPDAVLSGLEGSDVLIALTASTAAPIRSTKTDELKRAKRLRVAHGVYRQWDDFLRPYIAAADFDALRRVNQRVSDVVSAGDELRVTSASGTDFRADISGMDANFVDLAHNPGDHTNIAWGEVYFAPNEGKSEGVLVIDGPVLLRGNPPEPIHLHVRDNRVVEIEGRGTIADELRHLIANVENADNIGEVAIGTHPLAENVGTTEPKKLLGSVHIAMGDGILYGQSISAPVHVDCVMLHPEVHVDDRLVAVGNELQV